MSGQDMYHIEQDLLQVGTHANPNNQLSAMQLAQDVNASLVCPSLYSDHASDNDQDDSSMLWDPSFNAYPTPSIFTEEIRPLGRVDSGLNARARPFFPQHMTQQWQDEIKPLTRGNTWKQLQLLTPIKTDFNMQPQPHSAPALDYQNGGISPMLTFTDETSHTHIAPGYQWPWSSGPARNVEAWTQNSAYTTATLGPNYLNPALLTPTSAGGSSVSRSRSQSVTSNHSHQCDHAGCHKSFKTKAEYSHHRRNHGIRKHKCEDCQKKFVFKKDLTRHEKTHRPEEREFFCSVPGCPFADKGFQRKDHHDRHMKTHEQRGEGPLTPLTISTPMSRSPSYM